MHKGADGVYKGADELRALRALRGYLKDLASKEISCSSGDGYGG